MKKEIDKCKLFGEFQLPQARTECAVQKLFNHPNIVELYTYTECEQFIVLFMEYCNDASYFEHKLETKKREIKNERKILRYAMQILEALDTIHKNNIIHADIKLTNLLLHRPDEH